MTLAIPVWLVAVLGVITAIAILAWGLETMENTEGPAGCVPGCFSLVLAIAVLLFVGSRIGIALR